MSSICFVAGDPSGDAHASRLIEALQSRSPNLTCSGLGGKAMQAAHNKIQADLPAMLCGLDEAEMQEKIKDNTTKLEAQLSDETSELYQL